MFKLNYHPNRTFPFQRTEVSYCFALAYCLPHTRLKHLRDDIICLYTKGELQRKSCGSNPLIYVINWLKRLVYCIVIFDIISHFKDIICIEVLNLHASMIRKYKNMWDESIKLNIETKMPLISNKNGVFLKTFTWPKLIWNI